MDSPRVEYAERTLESLFLHLRSSEPLWLHIADDGSPSEYREHLWDLAGKYAGPHRSITNSERRGYGASYNAASQVTHQIENVTALLQVEDDWILQQPLDLDLLVAAMAAEPRLGCIRLGYIGYIPGQNLRAEFLWVHERHYLLFDPDSPSQYIFSGGPRLERVQWSRRVGVWPEGIGAGEVELAVGSRRTAREGVAWPISLIKPEGDYFVHIGTVQVKNAPLKTEVLI